MQDGIGKLRTRLANWGAWLNHEADIGPKSPRCISLESRHIPEAGDVWDSDEPTEPNPNVPDAEHLERHIRQLECLHQYCLAVTYGGMPTLMRWRRIGEHQMQHAIEQAELLLHEALKKSLAK